MPYEKRVNLFFERRPQYAYGILHAARLAKLLGLNEISVIEFGVAGGAGLLNMEFHATKVESLTGITVQVFGFDTGEALPSPKSYKDLPHHWKEGFFKMDYEVLRRRLQRAKIILGDVGETVPGFCDSWKPPPIGFIAHDLDFYSSTALSFQIFESAPRYRLPRIFNYFDDIIGTEIEAYNEFVGELAAIHEFNNIHNTQKILACQHFRRFAMQPWHHQFFIHHDFAHPLYEKFVSNINQQLPLS